ncbi:MAG: hypothetical protein LBS50_04420 [Prevotellaceae bacterium]|jgi:hypothetical protein|nr:hypothetical protein [Prevotellaceae bacterium]
MSVFSAHTYYFLVFEPFKVKPVLHQKIILLKKPPAVAVSIDILRFVPNYFTAAKIENIFDFFCSFAAAPLAV